MGRCLNSCRPSWPNQFLITGSFSSLLRPYAFLSRMLLSLISNSLNLHTCPVYSNWMRAFQVKDHCPFVSVALSSFLWGFVSVQHLCVGMPSYLLSLTGQPSDYLFNAFKFCHCSLSSILLAIYICSFWLTLSAYFEAFTPETM